jgi:hypothetical protein
MLSRDVDYDTNAPTRILRSMKLLGAALLLATPVYPHNARTADLDFGAQLGSFAASETNDEIERVVVRGEVLWCDVSIETDSRLLDDGAARLVDASSTFTVPHRFHLRASDEVIEIDALNETHGSGITDGWRF